MTITPTQHQLEQEALALKYLDEQGIAAIKGYAGTGKTTMLKWIIPKLEQRYSAVVLAAPTHKAASVLSRKLNGREVRTCASVFGLKPAADGQGGYTFKRDPMADPVHFAPNTVLVIDESSMVGKDYMPYLEELHVGQNMRLLVVGDPAQLPPVNERPSQLLSMPGGTLTEVLRQRGGNPIIELATAIRETGSGSITTRVDAAGNGIFYSTSMEKWLENAIRQFTSDDYRACGDHARILAWRNDTVSAINMAVRESIHGHGAPRFTPGEWLVARDPWKMGRTTVLQNSEEVCVLAADEMKYISWGVWRLKVGRRPDDRSPKIIYVLHEREAERFEEQLAQLKRQALAKRLWRPYYEFKERFASVDHAYAMTVHKSQGSTFGTAYVVWNDLLLCRNPRERRPLVYVAVSRAADRLAILA